MTCPEIGNYGVSEEDIESRGPQIAGFVMRSESPVASNWRAEGTLRDYLIRYNIVAISDIDTRALTRTLRSSGAMRGVIATGAGHRPEELVERALSIPKMEGSDLVRGVTCKRVFDWTPSKRGDSVHAPPGGVGPEGFVVAPGRSAKRPLQVAAYDFGMKWNILRRFTAYGCDVRVFPATAPSADLLATEPDGVFLSNGPGDPAALPYAVEHARAIVESGTPTFGICLGHQILGLAMGGRTYKLKFGHRGTNHPVKHLATGQVEITSQNHGFAVDAASLPPEVEITHTNLYDGTVEGLRHRDRPVFSVQYHPEAAPGPHDADYLFGLFLAEMERRG
jgi:carbamoyl-phosphate synthase small subunit